MTSSNSDQKPVEENATEKWYPLVEYYMRNGVKKDDIDDLIKRLEEKKDKFVKSSYYNMNEYNNIINQWRKDRKVFTSYKI